MKGKKQTTAGRRELKYQSPQLLPKGLLAAVIQKLGNSIYTPRMMVALGTRPHSYAKIAAQIPSGPDYTQKKRGCSESLGIS